MARLTAYTILKKIDQDDAYSHIVVSQHLQESRLNELDKRLATALVYTTITWQSAIDIVINRHLRHKLCVDKLEYETKLILRLGACQSIFFDRIPNHAIVSQSVELAKKYAPRRVPFVNAVLRSIVKDKKPWWDDSIEKVSDAQKPVQWLATRYALPTWLANRLIQQFNDEAEEVAAVLTTAPNLYLRKINADKSATLLKPKIATTTDNDEEFTDVHLEEVDGIPSAFVASNFSGSLEGYIVQDLGSQLVGHFAIPTQPSGKSMRVLDACAGLGGKTIQLIEHSSDVTAVDPNPSKLKKLETSPEICALLKEPFHNKKRHLQLHCQTLQEFRDKHLEEERPLFDHILLDAPCTGFGVIRRHPETKWRRREADITSLSSIQSELLDTAAELTQPGGTLVYSVCTFTPEETHRQITRFLERHHPNWKCVYPVTQVLNEAGSPIAWKPFLEEKRFLRLYPHRHQTDGFFAARLKRIT